MRKTLFTLVLAIFCSFTFGQDIPREIIQSSEVSVMDTTSLNPSLATYLHNGRVVPKQKTYENSLCFEDSVGEFRYILTYEPLAEYDKSSGTLEKEVIINNYTFYDPFYGNRRVFLYQVDSVGNYQEATAPIYNDYAGQNDFIEIYPYTVFKGDGLATSFVWRITSDLIVMFIKRRFQVEDNSGAYNHKLYAYNDIVFFKETKKGFFEHIIYSPENLYKKKPELVPKVFGFDGKIITFEMVNGKKYEFNVSLHNEITQRSGKKLEKNESSLVYTNNGD